jgi:hypothetical protein
MAGNMLRSAEKSSISKVNGLVRGVRALRGKTLKILIGGFEIWINF